MVDEGRVLASDGAWGTMLQSQGLEPGECPELWNLTHSEVVLEIARGYIEAGAEMIETNTFGANRIRLMHFGLENDAVRVNEAGASISREAAGDRIVLGSIGPTGKVLMMGEVSEEEVFEAFREQIIGLESGGANALCIETFTAIDEAVIAVKAARMNAGLEIACTFAFDKSADGSYRTIMGHTVGEVVEALKQERVDIIGANCGNSIVDMIEVVREMRRIEPEMPILAQPNAGMPSVIGGKIVYPDSPEFMASKVPELIEAGADIIGGCCGTTPEHIKAIAKAIREHQ